MALIEETVVDQIMESEPKTFDTLKTANAAVEALK